MNGIAGQQNITSNSRFVTFNLVIQNFHSQYIKINSEERTKKKKKKATTVSKSNRKEIFLVIVNKKKFVFC